MTVVLCRGSLDPEFADLEGNAAVMGSLSEAPKPANAHRLILILLDQPDEFDLEYIQTTPCDVVLAHEGVRYPCRKFTCSSELYSMLSEYQRVSSASERLAYVESLGVVSREEAAYAQKRYGIELKTSEAMAPPSAVGRGRLVTFRGSSGAFRDVIKVLEKEKKSKRSSRILYVDGDLLLPTFDRVFGIQNIYTNVSSYLTGMDNTGINIALELSRRGKSAEEIVEKTTKRLKANQYVLLGNYNIYNYEYYKREEFSNLFGQILHYFDLVVVRLTDFLYDGLAMLATHIADFNIIVFSTEPSQMRYVHQLCKMLKTKQELPSGRIGAYRVDGSPISPLYRELFGKDYRGLLKHALSGDLRRLMR